jgi:hypothetical protein
MYAKCGSIEVAWKVFNKMPFGNVVSWNIILGGSCMDMARKLLNISNKC